MLKSLKTKNFRKLEDNHFTFEDGMVIIRGSNEAGKSTLTEAIAYALFGVKSCRGSLADVVTWGKADTTLAVELVMVNEGVDYTIKRSKSGAEITYAGGMVTGQTECSNFVEGLFGVNNGNVGKLVSSAQGDIRGALAQGPKATMELIENLANFDLLDTIVELVQTNLLTGPTAAAEAVVASAELRHELVQAGLVEPETAEWEERALRSERTAAGALEDIAALKPELDAALSMFNIATTQKTKATELQNQVTMFNEQVALRNKSITTNELVAYPTDKAIADAEKAVTDALNIVDLTAEYVGMKKLMDYYPEDVWEGSEADLDNEIDKSKALVNDFQSAIYEAESEVRVLLAQKVTGSVCGFCNQDVSKFPEVLAKNTDIDKKVAAEQDSIKLYKAKHDDGVSTLNVLRGIKKAQAFYKGKATANVQEHVEQIPYSLSWIGEIPDSSDTKALDNRRTELQNLKNSKDKFLAASARISSDKEMITELQNKISINDGILSTLTHVPEFNRLREIHEDLDSRMQTLVNIESGAKYEVEGIRAAIIKELADYNAALQNVADAAQDVEIARQAVTDLVFNNNLVKRLRAARPLIADKLWNVVLSAVSTYFSAMRGTKSAVTKEANGFKVDGQSVEGLSGSTLDILGLSIRLALTRTFLPAAPFLILDEPSAAMDDKRTQEMTSFLLAFGFKQTIMVTHKDVDEAAANQLIIL